jgi:hypothetical protein
MHISGRLEARRPIVRFPLVIDASPVLLDADFPFASCFSYSEAVLEQSALEPVFFAKIFSTNEISCLDGVESAQIVGVYLY